MAPAAQLPNVPLELPKHSTLSCAAEPTSAGMRTPPASSTRKRTVLLAASVMTTPLPAGGVRRMSAAWPVRGRPAIAATRAKANSRKRRLCWVMRGGAMGCKRVAGCGVHSGCRAVRFPAAVVNRAKPRMLAVLAPLRQQKSAMGRAARLPPCDHFGCRPVGGIARPPAPTTSTIADHFGATAARCSVGHRACHCGAAPLTGYPQAADGCAAIRPGCGAAAKPVPPPVANAQRDRKAACAAAPRPAPRVVRRGRARWWNPPDRW